MQPVIPLHLLLATAAKVLCSAVFVSNRDASEAIRNSAFQALKHHQMDAVLRPLTDTHVDRAAQRVTMTLRLDRRRAEDIVAAYRTMFPDFTADWTAETNRLATLGAVSRSARSLGDQGSAILRQDDDRILFDPVPVRTTLAPANTQPWPNGDLPSPPRRSPLDRTAVAGAIDGAFRDASACTAAVAVVHHGDLVGERYALGAGPETQLESWSMGKSVTASLIGVLAEKGLLTADQPAPIPAWRRPGDPRGPITIRDLLQMSSGLRFSGQDDPRESYEHGLPDHLLVYAEAIDVFDFATSRPVEHPPQTVGRYRNCDPLSLGFIVKDIVTNQLRANYLQWPQAALFDRIGVRRQVLETDIHGNFVMSGFDYGTARNWARLGLLYLQDGVWEGKRVLPAGWAKLVGSPAPAWDTPRYGGQFWTNQTGEFELPRDAYYMAGAGQQHVFIVPSADLVVVRLGHRAGDDTAKDAVNVMLREVMRAVGGSASKAAE